MNDILCLNAGSASLKAVTFTNDLRETKRAASTQTHAVDIFDDLAIETIELAMNRFPEATHVACFDTAFHHDRSDTARRYALAEAARTPRPYEAASRTRSACCSPSRPSSFPPTKSRSWRARRFAL